jgi:hypothetical protein
LLQAQDKLRSEAGGERGARQHEQIADGPNAEGVELVGGSRLDAEGAGRQGRQKCGRLAGWDNLERLQRLADVGGTGRALSMIHFGFWILDLGLDSHGTL